MTLSQGSCVRFAPVWVPVISLSSALVSRQLGPWLLPGVFVTKITVLLCGRSFSSPFFLDFT